MTNFLLKQIAEKNNNEIFRSTNEMMLIAENLDDINFVEESINQFDKIKSKLDNIISEEMNMKLKINLVRIHRVVILINIIHNIINLTNPTMIY